MIEYTLRQLEVFAAAAEQESLTRAAELLHLTQSTASTHLRTLEQVLGVTLLLRRGQAVGGRPAAVPSGQKNLVPVPGPVGSGDGSPPALLPAADAGRLHRAGAVYAAGADGRLCPAAPSVPL